MQRPITVPSSTLSAANRVVAAQRDELARAAAAEDRTAEAM
jgi:hypothetical protein